MEECKGGSVKNERNYVYVCMVYVGAGMAVCRLSVITGKLIVYVRMGYLCSLCITCLQTAISTPGLCSCWHFHLYIRLHLGNVLVYIYIYDPLEYFVTFLTSYCTLHLPVDGH